MVVVQIRDRLPPTQHGNSADKRQAPTHTIWSWYRLETGSHPHNMVVVQIRDRLPHHMVVVQIGDRLPHHMVPPTQQ